VADDPERPSDLEVTTVAGTIGVEVKSTTYNGWLRHGRCVGADQLYETDAEVYVWCAGPDTSRPAEIHVVGWSTTADVSRGHTAQRYTGQREVPTRLVSAGATAGGPGSDRSPEYDLDDVGFDEHVWQQAQGAREMDSPEPGDVSDDSSLRDVTMRYQPSERATVARRGRAASRLWTRKGGGACGRDRAPTTCSDRLDQEMGAGHFVSRAVSVPHGLMCL
jgi:hypothetical protein